MAAGPAGQGGNMFFFAGPAGQGGNMFFFAQGPESRQHVFSHQAAPCFFAFSMYSRSMHETKPKWEFGVGWPARWRAGRPLGGGDMIFFSQGQPARAAT